MGTTTTGTRSVFQDFLQGFVTFIIPGDEAKMGPSSKQDEVTRLRLLLNLFVGRADRLQFRVRHAGFVALGGKSIQEFSHVFMDFRQLAS